MHLFLKIADVTLQTAPRCKTRYRTAAGAFARAWPYQTVDHPTMARRALGPTERLLFL